MENTSTIIPSQVWKEFIETFADNYTVNLLDELRQKAINYGWTFYDCGTRDTKLKDSVWYWCQLGEGFKKDTINFAKAGNLEAQKTLVMAAIGRIPTLSSKTFLDLLTENEFKIETCIENLKSIQSDISLNLLLADYKFSFLKKNEERTTFYNDFISTYHCQESKIQSVLWQLETWDPLKGEIPQNYEEIKSLIGDVAKLDDSKYLGVFYAKLIYFGSSLYEERNCALDFLNECKNAQALYVLSQVKILESKEGFRSYLDKLQKYSTELYNDKTLVLKIYQFMTKYLIINKDDLSEHIHAFGPEIIVRACAIGVVKTDEENFDRLMNIFKEEASKKNYTLENPEETFEDWKKRNPPKKAKIEPVEILMNAITKIPVASQSEEFEIKVEPLADVQYFKGCILNEGKVCSVAIKINNKYPTELISVNFSVFSEDNIEVFQGIKKAHLTGISIKSGFKEMVFRVFLANKERFEWYLTNGIDKFKIRYSTYFNNIKIQDIFSETFKIIPK